MGIDNDAKFLEIAQSFLGNDKRLKLVCTDGAKWVEGNRDQKYDYIFIDCPPSLNMLTLNAMVAADSVIIAMQCEYYALEGLSDLLATVKKLQSTLNPELGVSGIIRTMFDNRNKLCVDVSQQLIEHFGNVVFQTIIPRNVRLAEAPSHGLPVLLYDKTSRGAAAYMALGSEMLRRRQQRIERQIKKQAPQLSESLV